VPQPSLITERLVLRELAFDDAGFVLSLLNDADFIHNIGDRDVRNLKAACNYIEHGPMRDYKQHRCGLLLVAEKATGQAIGLCGLLKRVGQTYHDVGYALLPSARGRGLAFEAAQCVVMDGQSRLKLKRIDALVAPHNAASIKLLKRLGFVVLQNELFYADGETAKIITRMVLECQ
jgi:RimJ/RimL family protein N-acetyltransferase